MTEQAGRHPGAAVTRRALAAIAVALVAVGALAIEPASAIDGANSGAPGSTCVPEVDATMPAAQAGVSTSALGKGAPAYYEVGQPTGIFVGQRPKGTMLVIHGGGWFHVGPGAVGVTRPDADRWRARGWTTVNLTYRACGQSVADVLWFYDRARALYGSSPVCATGMSAGGHLALMIAKLRSTISCVATQGAPSDLAALSGQTAFDPSTLGQQAAGPAAVRGWAAAAFGELNLSDKSPALFPIAARVLAATAEQDTLIPAAQDAQLVARMHAANPAAHADALQLAPGSEPFTHANVSAVAIETFWQHELELVKPLVGSSPSHATPVRMSATGIPSGTMQLGASVRSTSAVLTAGSTPLVLDPGGRYQIETCVGWFGGAAPVSTCKTSAVIDTTASGSGVRAAAPTVTTTQLRTRTGTNFAMAVVTVTREAAPGVWETVGTSWPATGLAGSGFNLPATA
jgi:acetyl esterase/lipase